MIFLPRGNFHGEIPDPDKLVGDLREAYRAGSRTDQWSWARDAFPDLNVLKRGDPVAFDIVSQECTLGTTFGTLPLLPGDASADANIWTIPYNRGYDRIGTDAGTEMKLDITTAYPSLLIGIFQGQYVRKDRNDTSWWGSSWYLTAIPRVRWALRLNGADLPGTGPSPYDAGTGHRGAGTGEKCLSACGIAFTFLTPGTHVLEAVAGQAPAIKDGAVGDAETELVHDDGPGTGVCIGSRKLFYFLLPFSALLGA